MRLYFKHHTANFFYAVDIQNQQVESCCTVGGRERVERYEGVSGALQTGNVIITEQDYISAKEFALRQLELTTKQQKDATLKKYLTDFLFSPLN